MKIIFLLAYVLLISSCASTPQSRQILAQLPTSLPRVVELADTPFYPQLDYQCGPAALATVIEFKGANTSLEELSREMYIPARKGSLQIEMMATARRHGMLPYQLAPQLFDLFTEIAAGNPVLVFQNLSFQWYPQWHYAVVMGYDIDKHEIILRSGKTKRWMTTFEAFERTWQRADYWALVIVPVGEIPKTAKPLAYLKTAIAFEETGHTDLALNAYQSATLQWPDVAATWLTLGNVAYQYQYWPEAINAFKTAASIEPTSPVSWNNLAYALHDAGCITQAQQALECGLKIAATDANLQDSLQDLKSRPVSPHQVECVKIACYQN
ncbi:MAG: PA2778 family cysteine peptidase [Gammaproteobacteria bacterium]|nr:PA2778 family cysteine peptidase [Gammaproteobacteria bacterium]